MVGDSGRTLFVLLGAVGLLLLVACANVAVLSLARGLERGHEASIRLALGATRGRLVRQFLVESLLARRRGGPPGRARRRAAGSRLLRAGRRDLPRLHEISARPSRPPLRAGRDRRVRAHVGPALRVAAGPGRARGPISLEDEPRRRGAGAAPRARRLWWWPRSRWPWCSWPGAGLLVRSYERLRAHGSRVRATGRARGAHLPRHGELRQRRQEPRVLRPALRAAPGAARRPLGGRRHRAAHEPLGTRLRAAGLAGGAARRGALAAPGLGAHGHAALLRDPGHARASRAAPSRRRTAPTRRSRSS